jgi:UDP-N-acetylglucosamine--N-acetylmuramyl-(pentapeptide) pyrophosphoryl-undecaprenol N-acetylglucosamine transferase
MNSRSHILLAAGGTGGHMFPAAALGRELLSRGRSVSLLTDQRGLRYPGLLRGIEYEVISAASLSGGGVARIKGWFLLAKSIHEAIRFLRRKQVGVVVGFGGYPALPSLAAARLLRIPFVLHEQNSVLGRVNRLFARSAKSLALSFQSTSRVPSRAQSACVVTGNPVRKEIAKIGKESYPSISEDRMLRLLIVGGSQGARIFSDIVPQAISLLPAAQRKRIQVTQQCRQEDFERVTKIYRAFGIHAEIAPFFKDIPDRLRWAHLVISRAGATTLAEVTTAGRPALLVPLSIATDDHQRSNANALIHGGGGWLMLESEFTSANLAKRLIKLFSKPNKLRKAAKSSLELAKPGATKQLAEIVERPLPKIERPAKAKPKPTAKKNQVNKVKTGEARA